MSEALERSASVLADSGTSFEEYLGLVTAGTEITRDANKVANGLKTISLRLQGMTDEGEKDLELMAKLGPELAKIGVATEDSEGNLRSTYDILKDLSVAYKDLSASEKSYYTQLVAGVHQSNVATSILSNFQSAIDATSTALDSNGSALKENEAYLDSIAGRISILQSEFQKLSYTTVNSDFIKGVIEMGTSVLRLINNLGGLTPVLSTILGVVSMFKREKLTELIVNTTSEVKNLGPVLSDVKKNFVGFITAVKSGNGVLSSFGTLIGGIGGGIGVALIAIGAITSAISAYNQHQKELMQNAEESIQSFSEVSSSIDDVRQQYLNILDSTDSYTEKQEQLAELQDTLIKQYGMEEEAVRNLNLERQNGLDLLSEEIKKNAEKTMAETGSQYQRAKSAIEKGTFGTSATEISAFAPVSDMEYIKNASGDIVATSQEVDNLTKRFGFLKASIEGTGVVFTIQTENMYDKSEKLEEVLTYLNERYNSLSGSTELESMLLQQLSNELDETSSVLEKNTTVFEGYNAAFADYIKNSEEFSTANIKSEEQFYDWSNSILEAAGSNEYAKDILEDYVEEIGISLGYIDDYSEKNGNLSSSFDSVSTSLEESLSKLQSVENAYSTLAGAVDEYNECGAITYDTLNNLLALDSEYLSMLDIESGKLVINSDKLREKATELKNNALVSNAAALGAEIYAIAMNTEGNEAETAEGKITDLSAAMEQLKNSGVEGTLGVAALTGGLMELNAVMSKDPLWNGFTNEQESAIQSAIDAAQKRAELIKNFSFTTSYSSKSSSGSKSKSSSSKKETDPLEEQSKIFKEQIAQMEHELFIMEKLGATEDERIKKNKELQKLVHSQAEWFRAHGAGDDSEYIRDLQTQYWGYQDEIESIEDEITEKNLEAFKERLQISEDYIEDRNFYDNWGADNEIAAWQRVLKWMKEEYFDKGLISWEEYSENVREINKKIWEAQQEAAEEALEKQKEALEAQQDALEKQQDALEATFSYMADQIQKEIDALEEQKDEIEDFYDKEIEKIKEKNEAQEETNEKLEKENALKEAQEALDRAKSQKAMRVYYEDVGWQWEADRDAVSDAEQAVEDAKKDLEELEREEAMEAEIDRLEKLKEEALANIDEQIDGWEKYKEEWSSVADKYEEEQDRLLAEQVLGIELEGDNWKTRLDNLQEYADQYINILEQIKQAQESINELENQIQSTPSYSGGGGGGGGGGSGPDYTKQNLDDYIESGGDIAAWIDGMNGIVDKDILEYANDKRNEKIEESGSDYEKFDSASDLIASMNKDKKSYSSGGIVDYTGNANVHGTKSRPEIMLNNKQAATLYNWIRGGVSSPKIGSNVFSRNEGTTYNFSGAAFNITTSANNFESLIKDIKVKIMNR